MSINKVLPALLAVVLTLPMVSAEAKVITLTTAESEFDKGTFNQGWWATNTPSRNRNPNHATGFILGEEFRSFYTFDLSKVDGRIKSATLRVIQGDQTGDLTLGLWDVKSPAAVVNRNINTNEAIFADLGSGESYGTFSLQPTDPLNYLDLELNLNALNDLRRDSGFFTIGASVIGSSGQFTFGGTGTHVTFLILDVRSKPSDIPEPSSIALMGLAMAGLAFNRRRKA